MGFPCLPKWKSGSERNRRSLWNLRINFIKPGIGEATRVLLRRIPWKIVVNRNSAGADELEHIHRLAEEKGVPYEISRVDLGSYKVCGLIKNLADV